MENQTSYLDIPNKRKPFILKWSLYNIKSREYGFLEEEVSKLDWKDFCDISIYNFENYLPKEVIKLIESKYKENKLIKDIRFSDVFKLFIKRLYIGRKDIEKTSISFRNNINPEYILLDRLFNSFGIDFFGSSNIITLWDIQNQFEYWKNNFISIHSDKRKPNDVEKFDNKTYKNDYNIESFFNEIENTFQNEESDNVASGISEAVAMRILANKIIDEIINEEHTKKNTSSPATKITPSLIRRFAKKNINIIEKTLMQTVINLMYGEDFSDDL